MSTEFKKIGDWIDELPWPLRNKIYETNLKSPGILSMDTLSPCLAAAIAGCIDWKNSPQGFDYWDRLTKSLVGSRKRKPIRTRPELRRY
jgi:hypothetical protein